jgi:hypothetical protein
MIALNKWHCGPKKRDSSLPLAPKDDKSPFLVIINEVNNFAGVQKSPQNGEQAKLAC